MLSLHTIALATTRARCLLILAAIALTLPASATASDGPLARTTPFTHALPVNGAVAHGSTCTGSPQSPGVLFGKYYANVTVTGECVVDDGEVVIHGNLILTAGSAVLAAFGSNDVTHSGSSRLIVHGNIRVGGGASLLMGCEPIYFPCLDDPDPEAATLSSVGRVYGSVTARESLGMVLHNSIIEGNLLQGEGGGGLQCVPQGVFEFFPVYSDYEDLTVGGRMMVKDLQSCWLGVARVHVGGKLDLVGNQLADPDAIEVLANTVAGNLNCHGNSQVWDSAETGEEGLYPRAPEPNAVAGQRLGQCALASPETEGGPLGPGSF